MNTMTTYSGRKFDPMQMTPGDVYIEDIAHALSLLCRGGGQLTGLFLFGGTAFAQLCYGSESQRVVGEAAARLSAP